MNLFLDFLLYCYVCYCINIPLLYLQSLLHVWMSGRTNSTLPALPNNLYSQIFLIQKKKLGGFHFFRNVYSFLHMSSVHFLLTLYLCDFIMSIFVNELFSSIISSHARIRIYRVYQYIWRKYTSEYIFYE